MITLLLQPVQEREQEEWAEVMKSAAGWWHSNRAGKVMKRWAQKRPDRGSTVWKGSIWHNRSRNNEKNWTNIINVSTCSLIHECFISIVVLLLMLKVSLKQGLHFLLGVRWLPRGSTWTSTCLPDLHYSTAAVNHNVVFLKQMSKKYKVNESMSVSTKEYNLGLAPLTLTISSDIW